MTELDAHLDQLGDALVDGGEGVARQQMLLEVLRDELRLDVVAAEAERRLGEVVGAEAEEVGLGGDLSPVTAARGSSIMVPTGMSSSTPSAAATSSMTCSATPRSFSSSLP